MATVHVRYDGESLDIAFTQLDIGERSSDTEVKAAVSNYLNAPATKLNAYVVDRNTSTGDITIRPQAVFG